MFGIKNVFLTASPLLIDEISKLYEELKNQEYVMKLMEISQQNDKTKAPVVEESLVEKKEDVKEKKIIIDEDSEKVDIGLPTFFQYFKTK